ncbi:hypothetical protein LMG28138_05195 [Pararobbsia alpina]|uniref:Transcription regulator PadR N-terminal domain-containing protein n=2 Tax=Pararobbsia alpina TaxID=621374 RepID=A0A6S7BTU6_9BURK|nr:hypothetical protein LMG28138_05195 [Pararobbsia alpina]
MPRLLSPHELATLLLLMHAPAQVEGGNPYLEALRSESLVEVVAFTANADEKNQYRLTAEGNAVLRRLGAV